MLRSERLRLVGGMLILLISFTGAIAVSFMAPGTAFGTSLLGSGRLFARNPFKLLRFLNAVIIAALLCARRVGDVRIATEERSLFDQHKSYFALALTILVVTVYLPSFSINMWDHDWTHRHIGASLTSWRAFYQLFVNPQVDGMYRPLAFFSFALDYQIFGLRLWGYHIQSVALHLINTFLVWRLGRDLGLGSETGWVAAIIFGLAAVHFEAVLWPAARFDLLACMFSLLSFIFFVRWWRAEGPKRLSWATATLIAFVIAVLNKETGYCVAVVLPALMLSPTTWNLPAISRSRMVGLSALLLGTAAALVGIRVMLFHGPGGYGFNTGSGTVAQLSWKSVYLLIANVTGLSPFAVNNVEVTYFVQVVIALYVIAILVAGYWLISTGTVNRMLLGLAILSALPALPVIGWIRPSLQHTRHLYLPSVWIALFIAVPMSQPRLKRVPFAVFALFQVVALNWNISVYHRMAEKTRELAADVERDIQHAGGTATEVRLVNLPPDPNGVWYFDTELQHQIENRSEGLPVLLCNSTNPCGESRKHTLLYEWDPRHLTITRSLKPGDDPH